MSTYHEDRCRALEAALESAKQDLTATQARLAVIEAAGGDATRVVAQLRGILKAEVALENGNRTRMLQDDVVALAADKRALEALVGRLRDELAEAREASGRVRQSTIAAVVSAELRKVADAVECSALAGSPVGAARCLRGMAARWQRSGSGGSGGSGGA